MAWLVAVLRTWDTTVWYCRPPTKQVVQEIEWWPCKYEDVSFHLTTHVKSIAQWIPFDILVLERQRQEDPWKSLASWPSWNSKSCNNQ